jgi:hypothetical protein
MNMFWSTAIAAAWLVRGTYGGLVSMPVTSSHNDLLDMRIADVGIPTLGTRQSSSLESNATDSSTSMEQWDTSTAAACMSALSQLNNATNPSGTAVCYNLPSLDNSTGSFTADLRLFQVSEAYGDFSGISQSNIQVGVSYDGATVMQVSQANTTRRGISFVLGKRTVTALHTYMFVGKINMAQVVNPVTRYAPSSFVTDRTS